MGGRLRVSGLTEPGAPAPRPKKVARPKPKGGRLSADPSHDDVLSLQSTAGNQAVTSLLAVQRRKAAAQTGAERLRGGTHETPGAETVGGWKDADSSGPGWNAHGHQVGGVRRIPVDGLSTGQDDKVRGGASGSLTSEAADHRAIAVLPGVLKGTDPVDVLVHLHGYAENTKDRPYAGWRQHGGGGVRDVDLDRVEQQLDGMNQPRLMAVLPQGGEQSQFGGADGDYALKFGPYLADVLNRLKEIKALDAVPKIGRVIIGAHSGGGHTVKTLLSKGGKVSVPGHPDQGRLAEIVLFEAINNSRELKTVWSWVSSELERLRTVITANTGPEAKDAAVRDAARFRGYSRQGGGYGDRYGALKDDIEGWHRQHGAELGGWKEPVADLHRVVWTGVEHEKQVRERLDDALRALNTPAADRVASSGPGATSSTSTSSTSTSSTASTAPGVEVNPAVLRGSAAAMIAKGLVNEIDLTDAVFAIVHPKLGGKPIPSGQTGLQEQWRQLRREVVRPVLKASKPEGGTPVGTADTPGAVSSTTPAGPNDLGQGKAGAAAKAGDAGAHPVEAQEWGKLSARVQAAFHGGFKQYVGLRPLYAKRLPEGKTPPDWLSQLDFNFAFCGDRLAGLDPRLAARLTAIQEDAADIVAKVRAAGAPVVFEGAFQPRATTDKPDSLSDHALGLALHLNYKNNPYLGRKGATSSKAAAIIAKIAAGAGQEDFWKAVGGQKKQSAHERIVTNYHAYADASDAVAAYFQAMDDLTGDALTARKAEYDIVKSANSGRDPKLGFYKHTAHAEGDPMLKLVLLLSERAGLQWGGIYVSRPKDLHHFALKL